MLVYFKVCISLIVEFGSVYSKLLTVSVPSYLLVTCVLGSGGSVGPPLNNYNLLQRSHAFNPKIKFSIVSASIQDVLQLFALSRLFLQF